MAFQNLTSNTLFLFLLLFTTLIGTIPKPGFGAEGTVPSHLPSSNSLPLKQGFPSKSLSKSGLLRWRDGSTRRLMIGSMAPICTYNECRGCRFKCSAEQVPVDTNDPMNSAYHYRCVCHRYSRGHYGLIPMDKQSKAVRYQSGPAKYQILNIRQTLTAG